jgi:tRNA-2-methylthio-N6-dimethylallyladenosine synthase
MIKPTQSKIFLETYGCQMNVYDSELVKAILKKEDYTFTDDELAADGWGGIGVTPN